MLATYLCTQLEVNHDDGDLRAGDDEDEVDEEQEAKQVVELVLPDRLQHHKQYKQLNCERR